MSTVDKGSELGCESIRDPGKWQIISRDNSCVIGNAWQCLFNDDKTRLGWDTNNNGPRGNTRRPSNLGFFPRCPSLPYSCPPTTCRNRKGSDAYARIYPGRGTSREMSSYRLAEPQGTISSSLTSFRFRVPALWNRFKSANDTLSSQWTSSSTDLYSNSLAVCRNDGLACEGGPGSRTILKMMFSSLQGSPSIQASLETSCLAWPFFFVRAFDGRGG